MVAFKKQIRRFEAVRDLLKAADAPGIAEFGWTASALATSITALTIESSTPAQERACRTAIRLLERAGRGDDITPANAAWLVSRAEFQPLRPSRPGQHDSSARLGALAAWKLVDLVDFLGNSSPTPTQRALADMQLAVVVMVVMEAMAAVVGDFDGLSQEHRDEVDRLLKHQASMRAHAGRQEKQAPLKQRLVSEAMAMRGQKTRRQAARLTLQRVAKAEPALEKLLPKLRTLEAWLAEAGWIPRAEQAPASEK